MTSLEINPILSHLPAVVWQMTVPDLRVTYVSPAITSLLGYSPKQWLPPKFWQHLIHPDDKEYVLSQFSSLKNNRIQAIECRMMHAEGHYVWIRHRSNRHDSHIYIAMIDFSSYKKSETETNILLNRYHTMLSSLHEGVMLIDHHGNVTECNHSAAKIMNMSISDLKKRNTLRSNWQSLKIDGSYYTNDELPINQSLQHGKRITGAIIGIRYNHHIRWMAVNTCRVPIPELPQAEGGLITFTDITKTIETHRLLTASENRYRIVSEMTSDYIYSLQIIKPQHYQLEWSSGNLSTILNVPEDQLQHLPEDYLKLVHPEDILQLQATLNHLYKNQKSTDIHRIIDRTGHHRWLKHYFAPIFDPKTKRLTHVIGSITDITPQKEAEITSHALSQEIINTQERERQQLARDLHDNVGQAAPSILLHLKNISRLHSDPETQAIISTAEAELRQINHNIRRIHTWLEPKTLNVLGLVNASEAMVRDLCKALPIEVDLSLNALHQLPHPETHIHLFRIIQEAVRNAIKHSHCHHLSIKARLTNHHITLTIKDDGQGFIASHRPIGHFGLSIMEERARLLGAQLNILTKPGSGTSLSLIIPL